MAAGREPQQAIMEEHLKMQVMIGMLRRPAAGLSLDGTTVVMRSRLPGAKAEFQ